MLEIHLFVNPLGMQCYHCEQDVLRIDRDLQATKLNYQFVPLITMQTIEDTLTRYQLDYRQRQRVSHLLYQVSLDYKAALFQGGKRGRRYLLYLQGELIKHQRRYSLALIKEVAAMAGLDLEMFLADRESPLAKQAFSADQKMANELGVTQTASAVVFDTSGPDYGILIPDFDYASLCEFLDNGTLKAIDSPQDLAATFGNNRRRFKIITASND